VPFQWVLFNRSPDNIQVRLRTNYVLEVVPLPIWRAGGISEFIYSHGRISLKSSDDFWEAVLRVGLRWGIGGLETRAYDWQTSAIH
jgi:hypothetical protein